MNSNTEYIEVIAATTWAHDAGCFPSRIVLCRMKDDAQTTVDGFRYITWLEVNPESGLCYFTSGDYSYDIVEAWDSFVIRSRRHLNVLHGCDYPVCLNEDQVVARYAPKPEDKTYVAVAKVKG